MLVICEYARNCETSSNSKLCRHGRIHDHDAMCEVYGCGYLEAHLEAHCVDAFLEMVKERVEE